MPQQYLLLINEPIGQRAERGPDKGHEVWDRMRGFAAELQSKGVLAGTNSLQSTRHATRLHKRDGKQTLIDGPFAEAKEMVGGFFLVNVETKEEALAIAGACPAAEWATIEVRGVGPCYED
jgi:hypothetical protein